MTTFYHWTDGSTAAYRDGRRICQARVEYRGKEMPTGGLTLSEEVMDEARRLGVARFVLYSGVPGNYIRSEVTRARWLEVVQGKVRRAA